MRRLDYKWVALSNTTLGVLLAMINASILLIALPDIFRGIRIDPLAPGNSSYLLWLILGFLVAMSVLLVSLGRLGDMFGRVRMFNLGFAVFTAFSILLSVTWMHGSDAAIWLIVMRVGQGVGGALLFANSSAILTDAFPQDQRGLALGVNSVAAVAGSFIGLVLGGVLAPLQWRLVFVISVPIGVAATFWSYRSLRDLGVRKAARIDWWGNATFAVGLILLMVGITYGIQPYGGHTMGWTSPLVLSSLAGGVVLLAAFCFIETKVPEPMLHLELFKVRAFAAGNLAAFLAAMGRGGLQFILIIWLQGIWLPQHGYAFSQTPLWAGIYMLPLTFGILVAGPASGYLSDRFGARPFATGGMLLAALGFALLIALPVDFSYVAFSLILALIGIGMGLFSAPNNAAVMNSLPASQRGAGAGVLTTATTASSVLSIGVFFTLMIVGLAASLPHAVQSGLVAHGVPTVDATRVSQLPPVATLFASFLGYNPIATLLGPHAVTAMSHRQAQAVTGRSFFPHLISSPFHTALVYAFAFAIVACVIAAVASLLRGGKYHHAEQSASPPVEVVALDAIEEVA
ncbi:MAG TPA: MFS transporter [Gaiellaceae bacterium]|nr:MFS transporter [Gaiellaceae bacterium]